MRKFLLIICVILPNPIKIFIFRFFFHYKVGKGCTIGMSYIDCIEFSLGDNSSIGHFNTFTHLKKFKMGKMSSIGNFNRFSGSKNQKTWSNSLVTGSFIGISSHHHFDVGGGITLASNIVIGGINVQFWGHEIDIEDGTTRSKPIKIASQVYVASNVLIAPGAEIASNCIVGLGAVVPGKFKCDDFSIIVGNPARAIQKKIEVRQKLNEWRKKS
ncbi:acyltransferase [Lactococcus carnosus]|uniref:acyltransferase n=1 Tax=Pseudolactococcus carnosus TaxID=2749961 RepID=UPI001FB9154C|nr:hypothetical protein [Lactococcus carnosus]MCJ1968894.1 hypothetical protein [Lactococcus carnosus]